MAESEVLSSRNIKDNYTCSICNDVFIQPVRPSGCIHIFCKTCLRNASMINKKCPMCRKDFNMNSLEHQFRIEKEIKTLAFRCESCSEKIKIIDSRNHNCDEAVTPKSNHSLQSSASSASGYSSNMLSHPSNKTNRHTFTCPYCQEANLTLNLLRDHCNQKHKSAPKNMVCPVCVAMPWGDPNQKSIDFITHLNVRHQFEYDNFVDFSINDDEMLQKAIELSKETLNQVTRTRAQRI